MNLQRNMSDHERVDTFDIQIPDGAILVTDLGELLYHELRDIDMSAQVIAKEIVERLANYYKRYQPKGIEIMEIPLDDRGPGRISYFTNSGVQDILSDKISGVLPSWQFGLVKYILKMCMDNGYVD